MRTKVVLCALAAFAMSSPAMADIGTISLSLTHDGGSAADIVLTKPFAAIAIPIEVSFTATTSGTTSANRGVAGVAINIDTGLDLVDQVPMVLDPALVGTRNAFTTTTFGFTSFNDNGVPIDVAGDSFKEQIDAVAAFQGVTASFDFTNTKGKFKVGATAEGVGHSGPVDFATGVINVDPGQANGTYIITLTPKTTLLWDLTGGAAQATPGGGVGDTLTLIIVPEPATMMLLAPAAWVLRRRRNKKA